MTNPNSPDAAELTETIRSLRRQIRTRYLLSFVCWIGAVCAVTALVGSRDPDADRNTYAGIIAAVSLIGSLIFFVILALSDHQLEKRINGMQELKPADAETLNAWKAADSCYLEKTKQLEKERSAMRIAGFFLLPFYPLILILSEINYRNQIKSSGLHPGSPACALCENVHKHSSRCASAAVIIMLASIGFLLFSAIFSFKAHSKATVLWQVARSTYNAAIYYQNELDEQNQDSRLQTTIVNLDSPERNGDLHQAIRCVFNDSDRFNYAVICDENGIVTGALCSRRPITEYDLTHLQSFDEVLEKTDRMFRKEDSVGNYIAPQKTD